MLITLTREGRAIKRKPPSVPTLSIRLRNPRPFYAAAPSVTGRQHQRAFCEIPYGPDQSQKNVVQCASIGWPADDEDSSGKKHHAAEAMSGTVAAKVITSGYKPGTPCQPSVPRPTPVWPSLSTLLGTKNHNDGKQRRKKNSKLATREQNTDSEAC